MAPVPLQPRQKSVFMASGDNRGQKAPWWGSSVAVFAGKALPIGVPPIVSRRERGKRSGMVHL